MEQRPDDELSRVRLVYLGPPGYTLPFQVTFGQIGLFAVVTAFLVVLGWLLAGGDWELVSVMVMFAMVLTAFIAKHVDPDRPARKVIWSALTDWRRTRPTGAEQSLGRLSSNHIVIRENVTDDDRGGRRG